jgi:hypothetical protein
MDDVKLRNGMQEPSLLVSSIRLTLDGLYADQPVALYELTMSCRDRSYVIMDPATRDELTRSRLVESFDDQNHAQIHGSVRNIVLSAIHGDDFASMTYGSPIASAG